MASDKVLTYGEVKTNIHRINERMRYTYNKYGAGSTVTKELEKEMHRLIIGSGVKLTTNKKGITQIKETESNINKIMSFNLTAKEARNFRENAEGANPKDVYNRQVKQYLGKGAVKGRKRGDVVKMLNEVKPRADAFTKLLNKLLDHRLISSSTVNTIHRDEQGSRRLAEEIYNKYVVNGYSFTNERDLEEMSEYIHNDPVSIAYHSRREWNKRLGGDPTIQANVGGALMDVPENVRSYTSDGPMSGREEMTEVRFKERFKGVQDKRAEENPFAVSNNNPFGKPNKPNIVTNPWKKFD